jgi:hypothetical protein
LEQPELLQFAVAALERLGLPYMIVGSVASGAYGEPRLTRDIDIVVELAESHVDPLCREFPSDDFYVSPDAILDAVHRGGQFNIINPTSANKIDFMVARHDDWGREQMRRRTRVQLLPSYQGFAAQPEDIIISKLIYFQEGGSEKHLRDIAGMIRVSGDRIDRAYLERWVEKLGLVDEWKAVQARLS